MFRHYGLGIGLVCNCWLQNPVNLVNTTNLVNHHIPGSTNCTLLQSADVEFV